MTEVFNIEEFDWYTIETLQKLCYYETTATSAIKLLFKIANKENQLKQKAYNAFNHVFQSRLGETCLNYNYRLQILQDIEDFTGINLLVISAYQRALKSHAYSGNIHSGDIDYIEKQFKPSKKEELDYFKKVITKLKAIALDYENDYSELAKKALVFRLMDQALYGDFNGIMAFVKEISEKESALSQEIRTPLLELKSKKFDLSVEKNTTINEILEKYIPNTIKEELETIVINAPWVNEKNEKGRYINLSGEKAKELARKYFEDKNHTWLKHLDLLLSGEQKQTFLFAEELAKLYVKPFIKLNIVRIVITLSKIKSEQQNGIFLNGIISGCNNDEITRLAIDLLLKYDTTSFFSLLATKYIKILTYSDLEKIKPILHKSDRYLFNIEYLDYSNLTNGEFKEFINWVKEINQSFALQLIWELLRKEDRWNDLKDIINNLLYQDNIFDFKSSINSSLHIEDLILKSLNDNADEDKIDFITKKVLEKYQDYSFNDEGFLNNLLYSLLDKYWNITWPIIGEFLIDNSITSFGLRTFLDRITFKNEQLYLWALKDDKHTSIAIKYMEVFDESENGSLSWDIYAKKLIDEKGNTNKFLENLHSKFINYSIIGISAENLYKKRKQLIEELEKHKIKEVQEFAFNMKEVLVKNIEQEKIQRENYE
ncbi:hypothetical protein [Tenacibaculum halocynthiae]|uniref:hypothetical protein n=1 Tax=Tenacibaculum halocynthiae TaxID=1254437 RepID=UPI003894A274